jgi:hypothetical protein
LTTFPRYVSQVSISGEQCTVALVTNTACGPSITARTTVNATNEIKKLTRTNPAAAVAKFERHAVDKAEDMLRVSHQAVVRACRQRGTHNHG